MQQELEMAGRDERGAENAPRPLSMMLPDRGLVTRGTGNAERNSRLLCERSPRGSLRRWVRSPVATPGVPSAS